tara:strand:- start:12 stop:1217 length:1206 start_codon:yes stop_codon:yes gene_type:complete
MENKKLILIGIASMALIGCGPNHIFERTLKLDPVLLNIIINVGATLLFAIIGHAIIKPKKNSTRSYFNRFRYFAAWIWMLSVFSATSQARGTDPDIKPGLLFNIFYSIDFWAVLVVLNLILSLFALILAVWFPKKTNLGATLLEELGFKWRWNIVPPIVKNILSNKSLKTQGHEDFKYYEIASKEFESGKTHKGILAKAKVEAMGDSYKLEAIYIKIRADVLSAESDEIVNQSFRDNNSAETKKLDVKELVFIELKSLPKIVQKPLFEYEKIKLKIQHFDIIQPHSKPLHKVGSTLFIKSTDCCFSEDGKYAEYISMGIRYIGNVNFQNINKKKSNKTDSSNNNYLKIKITSVVNKGIISSPHYKKGDVILRKSNLCKINLKKNTVRFVIMNVTYAGILED